MEDLSGKYIELLKDTNDPSRTLTEFFCELYEIAGSRTSYLITFRKLIKLYHRDQIFLAILDTQDVEKFTYQNPYPLLSFFIKKRLGKKVMEVTKLDVNNLSKKKLSKRDIEEIKEKNPFGD